MVIVLNRSCKRFRKILEFFYIIEIQTLFSFSNFRLFLKKIFMALEIDKIKKSGIGVRGSGFGDWQKIGTIPSKISTEKSRWTKFSEFGMEMGVGIPENPGLN